MPAAADRPAPALDLRVFITGANGFIGSALAERFRELGAAVTGVDLEAKPEQGVVAGDVTAPDTWADALADVDVVVHTAALLGPAPLFFTPDALFFLALQPLQARLLRI